MKKQVLVLFAAIIGLGLWSCTKDEEVKNVKNLQLTKTVTDNVVTFTATAENALTYSWDFGNGETGSGATAEATYLMAGKYMVKCTANGQVDNLTDSIEVQVLIGDPGVYNDVAKLLTGYNEETGESTAVWKWAGNGTQPNDFGLWSSGPKTHLYTNDSAKFDFVDDFDDSWWKLGEYDGVVADEMLDDLYTFKLNQGFDFTNEYQETGFMWNWAWANKNFNANLDVWSDSPLMEGETSGSWKLDVTDHDADTLPKTIVSGKEVAKTYVITLKGGAYLGVGAASPIYQICRIDTDTLWIRYDNTYPQDLPIKPEWDDEGIALDDPEWGYFYLVKK